MRNIARLSDNDRRELFRNTADKMGLNDAIVEKDFWVCFTLDYLFHRSPWKESITFKGGTSLSKAFHLISRFSEDIDLILDWRVLGYGKDEPWEKRSNTKQDAFNKEANVRAEVFLSETFCPAVKAGLSQEIGCEANVYIDEKDKQTVIFAYPHLFTNTATLQVIRLEIGALAAWTPAKTALIEPYAAKYYPKIFEQKETAILTVAPERTFWEKATILHHEANRPEHLEMPQRYSRHYYDLYRMAATPVKEAAFSRLDAPMNRSSAMNCLMQFRNTENRSVKKAKQLQNVPTHQTFSKVKCSVLIVAEAFTGNAPSAGKDPTLTGSTALQTAG